MEEIKVKIAEMIKEALNIDISIEEIFKGIMDMKDKIHHQVTVDDLFFLNLKNFSEPSIPYSLSNTTMPSLTI